MDIGPIEVLLGTASLILLGYYYFTWNFGFWGHKNVKGPIPTPVYGNFKEVMSRTITLSDLLTQFYHQFPNESVFGIFKSRTPVLVLRDAELIKKVLIKDFSIFAGRGDPIFKKAEPLSCHLFSIEAERWRPLRQNLSPIFTAAKLKEMFYLLQECADNLREYLEKFMQTHQEIDCREITAKFATDVIGVCAFGLNMNALNDEDSEFRKMGRKIFLMNRWKTLKILMREVVPWLYEFLWPLTYDKELNEFFIEIFVRTVKYRKEHNIKRNDFVDLLMEIRDNPEKLGDIGKIVYLGCDPIVFSCRKF